MMHLYHDEEPDGMYGVCGECGMPLRSDGECPDAEGHYWDRHSDDEWDSRFDQ